MRYRMTGARPFILINEGLEILFASGGCGLGLIYKAKGMWIDRPGASCPEEGRDAAGTNGKGNE